MASGCIELDPDSYDETIRCVRMGRPGLGIVAISERFAAELSTSSSEQIVAFSQIVTIWLQIVGSRDVNAAVLEAL